MVLKRASLLILLLAPIVSVLGADLELAKAVIVAERTNPVVAKAAEMLQEEIEKRSGVRLLSAEFLPHQGKRCEDRQRRLQHIGAQHRYGPVDDG